MRDNFRIIDDLHINQNIEKEELYTLLSTINEEEKEYLTSKARSVREKIFGKSVYIRGLIEFSNYCRKDCYYCGIRASNKNVNRYRLEKEQILNCAKIAYSLGFRTFVMQGGEDMHYSEDDMYDIISSLRTTYEDCAITLSIGERDEKFYKKLYEAGANRFLLRHETINEEHYSKLHPKTDTIQRRVACLNNLKEIGFQVGCGIMIGSPHQTLSNIVDDIIFMKEFNPHMVGMGPFIPHKDTCFANEEAGSVELTLTLLSIVRLLLPNVLLPATTALGTVSDTGRERGLLAGANVVMPNISPKANRSDYALYNGKLATKEEAAEGLEKLRKKVESIGYHIEISRGDHPAMKKS